MNNITLNINVTTHLCLLVFLLSLINTHDQVLGAEQPDPVRDLDGNILRSGTDYYILPVIRGRGGGLTLASRGKKQCPLGVVQAQSEVDQGLPLTFTPVNPKKGVIRQSTDLNIKFSAATICVQTTLWMLDDRSSDGQYFITTGGTEGNPGPETISNWFKIEKYQNDYKLVFCPTVCNYCKVICKDVGIYIEDDGKRRLALSDDPFKVMFKKA